MKKNIQLLFIVFCFGFFNMKAQEVFYQNIMPNGALLNEQEFENLSNKVFDNDKYKKIILGKSIHKKDSTIIPYLYFVYSKNNIANIKFNHHLIGKPFPFLNYKTIDGNKIGISDLLGKPTIITIWYNNTSIINEIVELNKLALKYGDKVNFLALTYESNNSIKKFLETTHFNFIHSSVNKTYFENTLKFHGYPTTFIIGRNGFVKDVETHCFIENINIYEFILESLLED